MSVDAAEEGDDEELELCIEEQRVRAEQKRQDRIHRKQLEEKAAYSRYMQRESQASAAGNATRVEYCQ